MQLIKLFASFCILLLTICEGDCMDPISTMVAVGAAAATRFEQFICSTGLMECCSKEYVTLDTYGLKQDMKRYLHGQHIATSTVLNSMHLHVTDPNPSKPLVMSFHGWTGVGKSFVSRMIAEHLFKHGGRSLFVHNFYSDVHFKNPNKILEYKEQLHSWIYHNVSNCEHSLFIFDEMDHMPDGWIDVLVPFLGHNTNVDGVDFRKCIFIFLSVVGGDLITETVLKHRMSGKPREDIKLNDLQNILQISAYNQINGLKESNIIKRELIDHFIPFLPLEREHVRKCVEDEFDRRNITNYSNSDVNEVLEELQWFPTETKIFSSSGCKKVTHKITHTFN